MILDQSGCEKALQLVTAWWQFKNHPVYKEVLIANWFSNGYSVLARQQNLKSFPAPKVFTKKFRMRKKNSDCFPASGSQWNSITGEYLSQEPHKEHRNAWSKVLSNIWWRFLRALDRARHRVDWAMGISRYLIYFQVFQGMLGESGYFHYIG